MTQTVKITKHYCRANIYDRWGSHPCNKTAGYEHEGKHYCLRHHPENVQKKREAQDALEKQKWQAESLARDSLRAAQAEVERKARCYDDLLEALIALERTAALPAMYDDPMRVKARAAIAQATGGVL